jgi:hypothetical protein
MVQNDDKNNADRPIPIAELVNAEVVDDDNGDKIILRPLNNTYSNQATYHPIITLYQVDTATYDVSSHYQWY